MNNSGGTFILQFGAFDSKIRDYKPRRTHTKTRSGCLACKTKRCDELKPACSRCHKHGRVCTYPSTGHERALISSRSCIERNLAVLPPSCPSHPSGTPSTQLIHHFTTHYRQILGAPDINPIVDLAKSQPLVLNSLLAASACHLQHVKSADTLKHRISHHYHLDIALRQYRKFICLPPETFGQSRANAVMVSAMILNIPVFTLSGTENDDKTSLKPMEYQCSLTHSPEPALGDEYWLSLQMGLTPLLMALIQYFEPCIRFLGMTMMGDVDGFYNFVSSVRWSQPVPDLWLSAFGLHGATIGLRADYESYDSLCNRYGSIYSFPLMSLAHLRQLPPDRLHPVKALQFLFKLQPDFRARLYAQDERAVWIFCYWLGIMCRFEHLWWCGVRVRKDYTALLGWLEDQQLSKRPGVEGLLWEQMMAEVRQATVFSVS
ncbi:hypothetical protein NM208_g9830 [Fusarium decemcellulare]|uniref:Uncharacterized protein n=1 Tax=Fusarium decemcellulare TaxID=57161 RepID=A0ACC1S038_9HYPO|nr:hypothetical protein NM208_g9830 [Fusarium decemcellulare]